MSCPRFSFPCVSCLSAACVRARLRLLVRIFLDLSFFGGFGLTLNRHQRQKGQGGGGYVRKPFTLRQEPFTLCFVPGTERVIVQPSSQECCRLMPYTDQARIASPSHFTPALTNASIAAASPDSAPGRVPRPCKSVRDHVVRLQNPARPTHATYPAPYIAGHKRIYVGGRLAARLRLQLT